MNLSQNLSSKVFSAQSSRPIISLINMTKTNHCERKSSPIITGNQMVYS